MFKKGTAKDENIFEMFKLQVLGPIDAWFHWVMQL